MSYPAASSRTSTARNESAPIALSHYAGRAGDHNALGMVGSRQLAEALGARLGVRPAVIGAPEPALAAHWSEELSAAMGTLVQLANHLDQLLSAGARPVTASGRWGCGTPGWAVASPLTARSWRGRATSTLPRRSSSMRDSWPSSGSDQRWPTSYVDWWPGALSTCISTAMFSMPARCLPATSVPGA